MKKLTIIITIIGLVGFYSCKKDETKATLKSAPGASTLTIPGGSAMVLLKDSSNASLIYTWTKADYGAQIVVFYFLQIDKQGNGFNNAINLGTVNGKTSLSLLTSDLNSKLLTFEFDPNIMDPLPMEFRIQTLIKNIDGAIIDTIKPVNSAVIQQTITPYYEKIVYPLLCVPGSYQGWNIADSITTVASVGSNDKYEGYMLFPANTEFKFAKFSWDADKNWGDNGADGTLDAGGANIKVTDSAYYKINADLVGLTYTLVKTNWAVIGDATPGLWNTDTPMTYDATNKVWTVTLDLTAGHIKFRANGNWDLNYGDDGANGSLEEKGADIAGPGAGNYTITLNFSQPIYKYKFKKN